MKKIILYILIMIILVGCTSEIEKDSNILIESNIPIINNTNSIEKVDSISIWYPHIGSGDKYFEIEKWEEYISGKYEIELKINYTIRTYWTYEEQMNSVVYLNNFYNKYIMDEKILNEHVVYDLKEYYDKYNWYQYVDQKTIEYVTKNDKILALPVAGYEYITPRLYNKEYLEILELDIPKTVAEFYEYLLNTKIINKDDNTFYPLYIDFSNLIPATSDIFRAYDVYVNSNTNNAIGYNPKTQSFEDGVFSNNIVNALDYIRRLQDDNLLFICGRSSSTVVGDARFSITFNEEPYPINKNFASEYCKIYNIVTPFLVPYPQYKPAYEYEKGYYLEGTNKEKLIITRKELSFYLFPSDIKNIDGTVEMFNEIFTNEEYYTDFKYGILDTDYKIENDIILKEKPYLGTYVDLKLIRQILDDNEIVDEDSIEVIKNMPSEMKYDINILYNIRTLVGHSNVSAKNSNNFSSILFYDGLSVYDAIEQYKILFKKNNQIELINELNEKLGMQMVYDYSN